MIGLLVTAVTDVSTPEPSGVSGAESLRVVRVLLLLAILKLWASDDLLWWP